MAKTKEIHFEDAIEDHLVSSGAWAKGNAKDFDAKTALTKKDFFAFVEATQPETWADLRKHHAAGLEGAVFDTLVKSLDSRGTLDVLRHGFKFFGKLIDCAYFKPAHGMNPDILAKYAQNRLVVTRQVRFIDGGDDSIDLVLFVNGVPVATAELKNALTNQTVQDAVEQYRRRDSRHALFQFKKRALVHFAVDPVVKDPDVDGVEFTETGMNKGIKERELPQKFESDQYQVLLVANKYQTGFDQPLLHTMYVDKRLSGVQAVQTLSRLNRTTAGKEDTFVLDFVNDVVEIEKSFRPYYEQTVVAETADPHQLYELQHRLEATQVFWKTEVEAFCKVFYAPEAKQTTADQAEMYRQLNPGVDRFKALDEEKQDEFRNNLAGYVKLYSFLSQVMPFSDPDLEKLYTFARFLERKLPRDDKSTDLDLDGDVALKYYRLNKTGEANIMLSLAESVPLRAPTDVGTRAAKDVDVPLSQIIDVLNDRFGTEFTPADQLLFDQFIQEAKQDHEVIERAQANRLDNFELAMKPKIEGLMIDRMDQNQDIVNRYLNDAPFQSALFKAIVKRLYDEIRRPGSQPPASR
jgi:type I restriction enzyme R subunit